VRGDVAARPSPPSSRPSGCDRPSTPSGGVVVVEIVVIISLERRSYIARPGGGHYYLFSPSILDPGSGSGPPERASEGLPCGFVILFFSVFVLFSGSMFVLFVRCGSFPRILVDTTTDRYHTHYDVISITHTILVGSILLWNHFFFELRASLITFRIFVRCQRLIARNVAGGFLFFSLADTF